MGDQWQYQLRIDLDDAVAEAARRDPEDPSVASLTKLLRGHGAVLKCQYDAFADYVAEAESRGRDNYPLYAWTKDTIEDPVKKAKYLKSISICVDGDSVYDKEKADALEADLQPLVGGPMIKRLSKHDTNPANNPQIPAHYRNQE